MLKSLVWVGRQGDKEARALGSSGFLSLTHIPSSQARSTQLVEGRWRTAGPTCLEPGLQQDYRAERGFQEAGAFPPYHTTEPAPGGALAAP